MINRSITLVRTPDALPKEDDFDITSTDLPVPSNEEVLVQNLYLSVDPYLRALLRSPKRVDSIVPGRAVGRVIESCSKSVPVDTYVTGELGWSEYVAANPNQLRIFRPDGYSPATYLGALGMPGLTAWTGLTQVATIKPGEVLYVSAASGAVGSLAGQIALRMGCTVVGSTGSDDNVQHLIRELGFHHAFNYKSTHPLSALRASVPDGIDVYFENVGGTQLEAALDHMRPWGRIPVCGMIATYNDSADSRTPGPRNLAQLIYKRITMTGFLVTDYDHLEQQYLTQMKTWLSTGSVKASDTVAQGIESVPSTFIRLFRGTHIGKLLVELDT